MSADPSDPSSKQSSSADALKDSSRDLSGSRSMRWDVDSRQYQFARGVVDRLQKSGYIAYFAGGCVRDAMMGGVVHDYDVATDARIEEVIQLFGAKNTLGIGAAFGVACVHNKVDGERFQVEVATFRSDGTYSDGRRPDWVRFSSPEEDAQRRDFTINGMFYDPISESVKDFVGGELDLQRGQIRAIGVPDDRFGEDKLRMLRAVRFGARFGFPIARDTEDAIRRHASEMTVVSGERITAEMSKLFGLPHADSGIRQMFELGILDVIWPDLARVWRENQERMQRSLRLVRALPAGSGFSATAAAMAYPLPHGLVKSWAKDLQSRWKFSNQELAHLEFCLSNSDLLCNATSQPWSEIQPKLIADGIRAALCLGRAIINDMDMDLSGVLLCEAALQWPSEKLNPPPFLTGEDLKRAGIRPGPSFSKILREARALQLDGEHQSREASLLWLCEQFANREET